jgi:hypothetical protein
MSGARTHKLLSSMFKPGDTVECRICKGSYKAREMPKTKTGFRFKCVKCSNTYSNSLHHKKKHSTVIGFSEATLAVQSVTDRPETISVTSIDNLIVSTCGKVTAVNRASVLKPSDWDRYTFGAKGIRGYYTYRREYVHRLVAASFIGESNLFVNHIDSNKLNNDIKNLEYVSCRENVVHALFKRKLKKVYRHNTSGGRIWYSRIKNNGKDEYLGSFLTEKEAEAAFDRRFLEIHKESYYDTK